LDTLAVRTDVFEKAAYVDEMWLSDYDSWLRYSEAATRAALSTFVILVYLYVVGFYVVMWK
jgi:hypothetical protein